MSDAPKPVYPDYSEPELSVLVLDFLKPALTRACLQSVKRHIKFPVKVIYLHNGPAVDGQAYWFYQDGLVDQFIQTRVNNGLGVGTRDLVAACFSPWFLMLQNDQLIGRDFTQDEFDAIKYTIGHRDAELRRIMSVSLAGPVGGRGVYSERAHIMETGFYQEIERGLLLSHGGAGPFSHQQWREGQIQAYYDSAGFTHYTDRPPLVIDQGIWTIRNNPDGSRVRMRTDTRAVYWEVVPTAPYVFPEMTPEEWALAISGRWVPGTTPVAYQGIATNCWGDAKP